MTSGLRFGLLLAALLVFILIVSTVVKRQLNIKYSIVWILWSLCTLLMAIFPESFYVLTKLLGIALPVNALYLIMIALLYALVFFVYIMISKHNDEIIKLTYEIAVLKKELDSIKKKK